MNTLTYLTCPRNWWKFRSRSTECWAHRRPAQSARPYWRTWLRPKRWASKVWATGYRTGWWWRDGWGRENERVQINANRKVNIWKGEFIKRKNFARSEESLKGSLAQRESLLLKKSSQHYWPNIVIEYVLIRSEVAKQAHRRWDVIEQDFNGPSNVPVCVCGQKW